MREQHLDVLAIGEAVIDLISDTEQAPLVESRKFTMYTGGTATNVAMNVSRLGGSAAIVASIGDDAFSPFLRQQLEAAGVRTAYLHTKPQLPTTLVVVTRRSITPDFAIYRGADMQMSPVDMPLSLLHSTSLVHTSAFALSREPSRSTILEFVAQANAAGCLISFDPNYHPRIWEIGDDPLPVLARIYPYITLTKPSLDDCVRLFGAKQTPEAYAARFLALGAQQVILTMGSEGVLLANAKGTSYHSANPVEVVDVTGAGDAFWAGLILAILDGYLPSEAIRVAQAVAEIKLQQIGSLSHELDRTALYTKLGLRGVST
jgi:sugar/nucleoside kinase (ribokinase family)